MYLNVLITLRMNCLDLVSGLDEDEPEFCDEEFNSISQLASTIEESVSGLPDQGNDGLWILK